LLAAIRGARLEGFLIGKTEAPAAEIVSKDNDGKTIKTPNPAHESWLAQDQQVLSFLLSSLSKEILSSAASKSTAALAWKEIEGMFSSQTRARVVNTRMTLANTKKGNTSTVEYFAKMRALGDEMNAARWKLEDEELVEYILAGLDFEYNPVVSAVVARVEPISISELYTQVLAFEMRLELMGQGASSYSTSSANSAQRWRDGFSCGQGRGRGTPGRGGGDRDQNSSPSRGGGQQFWRNNNTEGRPLCQVCFKPGHMANRCWHRFDESYEPDPRHLAAAATNSYNIDMNWYTDTGATDHITGDLEKLSIRDKYHGEEQIHTASGGGIKIS
jgi:hypothetical protein